MSGIVLHPASDPVKGVLLTASADEIVVRCTDPRAGSVQVRFPCFGFELRPVA